MTVPPEPRVAGRIDRHWLHTVAFTLALVALVTLAMGADRTFAVTALATCGVGFGFFYLLFATGAHFGLVMANGLARVPIKRFLKPDEIGHLAVYLGSTESDGMTGQSILLDGGMLVV